jgi:signal peptidase II
MVRYKNRWLLIVAALIIGVDQWTKALVERHLALAESVPLIPHLNFTRWHNPGAAFSMLRDMPPAGFIALGTIVSAGIVWWLWRNPYGQRVVAWAMALIMGGALGNVIDRVQHGFVIDFIDFYVGSWHFATFNIADMAISGGAALLVLDMVLDARRGAKRGF